MRVYLVCLGLVAGCTSGPLEVPLDPSQPLEVQQGLYDVAIDVIADSCAPPLPSGSQHPDVIGIGREIATDNGLTVPLVGIFGVTRVPLVASKGYAWDQALTTGCGAIGRISARLVAARTDHVEVRVIDEPAADPACAGQTAWTEPCRAERTLRYDLLHACPDPLHVVYGADAQVDCW